MTAEDIFACVCVCCSDSGVFDCLVQTVRAEGLAALGQGLGASLAGIVPFCALDLALYTQFKECHARWADGVQPSSLTLLSFGAVSSTISQIATYASQRLLRWRPEHPHETLCARLCRRYPLALLRTLLQASGMPGHRHYRSMSDAAWQVVSHRGLWGFYRGLTLNMAKAVPSLSLSYVIYENTKILLASSDAAGGAL